MDWGLGHTTRCIPIIRYLLKNGHRVTLAGNEVQKKVLVEEFPDLPCLFLKGYQVRYSKTARYLPWQMLLQIPTIVNSIRHEHEWLQKMQTQHQFDLIVSDNRYGLYAKKIPSVILTHQTRIQIPRSRWLEKQVSKLTHRILRNFREVWIPDYTDHRLSGVLSENSLPSVRYLGLLSRIENQHFKSSYIKYLFILSGPEPQRSLLEEIILNLDTGDHSVVLIRGVPGASSPIEKSNWTILNHCSASTMQEFLIQAETVICRSGYSSLMDLCALGKKAVLIPTPGQTEQEYLARHFAENQRAVVVMQKNLRSEFRQAVGALEQLSEAVAEQPVLNKILDDFFEKF